MSNGKKESRDMGALVVGGLGGTALGAIVAALVMARPAEAAPPEEKLDYLIEVLTTLVPVLAQVAEGNTQLIESLQQWLAAQGVEPGVEVTVKTLWEAKEPEQIFDRAIRSVETFDADKMVDFRNGKRLSLKVESTLDQNVLIQVVGNSAGSYYQAVNIAAPWPCVANGNITIGLAWDDWHPYIGVRVIAAVAPTTGMLKVDAVIQE